MATSTSRADPTSNQIETGIARQPPVLPTDASSSSASFESSRPPSEHSSRTSQSFPSSPGSAQKVRETAEIELSNLPDARTTPTETSRHGSGSTVTAPSAAEAQGASSASQQALASPASGTANASTGSSMRRWMSKRTWWQWIGNSIGLTALVVALVGLFAFGYKTYKLDVYNSHMSYRQNCQGQVQINAPVDAACRALLALPVPPSPYRLIQRALNGSRVVYESLKERRSSDTGTWNDDILHGNESSKFPVSAYLSKIGLIFKRLIKGEMKGHGQQPEIKTLMFERMYFQTGRSGIYVKKLGAAFLAQVLLWILPLLLGAVVLMRHLRKQARVQEVFSSPARNEVQITRHYPDGHNCVVSNQGTRVIKHKPDEQHYLGELQRKIQHILRRDPGEQEALSTLRRRSQRAEDAAEGEGPQDGWYWRNHYSSTSILESRWTSDGQAKRPSSVTLRSSTDNEDCHHEGLIELKTKGSNKTFFDPMTGEFIRLTPWKASAADEGEDRLSGNEKGDTKKALARMGAGAVAFGGGKSVDDEIMEELDREDIFGERVDDRIPQRAGDTMAGLVTNEYPTGKPTTI